MNKKEFLKELENRLSILEEKEIKDIINEYRDIIEEKIKDGKSEKDAVNEFGSVDELCSEILKAYKINPEYSNNAKNKNNSKSFDEWIKSASNDLTKFIKNISNNLDYKGQSLSLELVMEIFIKIIIFLIILAVLKIPFSIIGGIGRGIFTFNFTPIDSIFVLLWWIFSCIVYLGLAILTFWTLFREYFNAFDFKDSVESKNSPKAKKKETENKKINSEIIKKEEISIPNVINPFILLIKILVLCCILLPLWLSQAALIFVFFLVIYYVISGINIWGLIIVITGIMMGLGALSDFIYNLTFNTKKLKIYSIIPMIISVPIMMIGGTIFAYNVLSFDYINESPNYNLEYQTIENTFSIENNKQLKFSHDVKVEYLEDNNYSDNTILLILSYPYHVDKIKNLKLYEKSDSYLVDFKIEKDFRFKELKNIYDELIDNLKDGKIYNYHKLYQLKITIVGNTNTITNIK